MNISFRKFLKLGLSVIFVISFSMFVYSWLQHMNAKKAYEQAESITSETICTTELTTQYTTEEAGEEMTEEETKSFVWMEAPIIDEDPFINELLKKNLEALREVNPDVLGWIEIPGTQLAYPIMDGDDNEYYLEHTWDKQSSLAGSIFLEQLNNSDLRDFNTLIYGHRMANGSMFGSLKHYSTKEYFEAYPYVYILDDTGVHRYEIFSAYTAPVNGFTFVYGFLGEDGMQQFLDYCITKSEIDTDVIPTLDDKILTLVTCTGRGYDARWVVQARLKGVEDNPRRFFDLPADAPESTESTEELDADGQIEKEMN